MCSAFCDGVEQNYTRFESNWEEDASPDIRLNEFFTLNTSRMCDMSNLILCGIIRANAEKE